MDFKVEISCEKCECSFELRPVDFKQRCSMECPNCGQAFPADIYEELKTGVIALGNVPEYIGEDSDFNSANLFKVRVKSFGILHKLFGQPND